MKHTRRSRFLVLCMALMLLCTALISCSDPLAPSEDDLRVVATCGDYDICYDEFRYITLAFRDEYTARYGDDIWTDPSKAAEYLPALKADVEDAMKINASILATCAEFGISPDDSDIQDSVDQQIELAIEEAGGKDTYLEYLASTYMTNNFVRYTLTTDLCESALAQTLLMSELIITNELDFLDYAMNDRNMCATYHIFIGNDEGDDIEQNRKRANEVRDMITSGTKLTSLIGSVYNEDVYAQGSPYHFMKTEYDEAYENTAFALEIGEVSDVVETEDGFYIIERQPLSESYVVGNLTELFQRYQFIQVETLIADRRAELTLGWTDFGKTLSLLDIE